MTAIKDDQSQPIYAALQQLFGYTAFRPHQEEIIRALQNRRDAFVVMPTGGGKSLCYQLPAHLMPGTCLVISPLISLMKDQVDAAQTNGLRADYLNSSQTASRRAEVLQQLNDGQLDLLYVSPERFAMPTFRDTLQQIPLSFVAIDEAHCISEWGHDFRKDYLELSVIRQLLPEIPIAAFTATATLRVQQDIIQRLDLRGPLRVRASFNRPNLYYRVIPKHNAEQQILAFVKAHPGEQGIVYRTTRNDTESTASVLKQAGLRALPYHAGLPDDQRARNQEAFNRDEVDVVVATIAFGMGIDKSNVRYVVHGDLPKNIEGYYQETGRAGRDGEPAECVLFYSSADIQRIRYFLMQLKDPAIREHALRCMQEMARFGSSTTCRRRQLLAYFDETFTPSNCGMCDVCAGVLQKTDATRDAQITLSAVARTGQRYGASHIVDIVAGANKKRVRDLQHDQLKTFGAGRDKARRHWQSVIDALLAQGWAHTEGEPYPVLKLAARAWEVLKGNARVTMLQPAPDQTDHQRPQPHALDPEQQQLFEHLRALRKQVADDQGVPPFVVFSDRSLREMALHQPETLDDMSAIHGVGTRKLEQYGSVFTGAVQAFLDQLDEEALAS
jgi:ATP-dependent DNA helicase RecQ